MKSCRNFIGKLYNFDFEQYFHYCPKHSKTAKETLAEIG